MARKRAPGAGRPPGELGLKGATLSLRLPQDLRDRLVAAAKRNKRRSVSEEIVLRLRATLDRDWSEGDRPLHIQALSKAVARIAVGLEARTKRPWNDDRYTQEQLSKGIDLFLYTYSRGEADVPPAVAAEAARDPEDTYFAARLGEMVAGGIISSLKFAPKPLEREWSDIKYPDSWRSLWEIEQDLKGFKRRQK
jgi:hypothetical protein